jgi:tetratricopeptide (TPR) repeat protein
MLGDAMPIKTLFRFAAVTALLATLSCLNGCATTAPPLVRNAVEIPWNFDGQSPEAQLITAVLAGEYAARQGFSAEASQLYAKAAELSDDPKIAARATQLALIAEDADLALAAAQRWITLAPDNSGPYEIAARLALRDARWEQAVELLRASLRLSDAPDAVVAVAEVIAAEPRAAAQAMGLFAQICEEVPVSAQSEFARGLLAYRVDQPIIAQAAIQQALLLEPDWRQAQLLALRLHLQAAESTQAAAVMRDLHVAAPKDLELRLALGGLLLEFEQFELAHKEFSRALKIAPDNIAALYAIALIEMDSGDPLAAKRHFDRLVELGGRTSEASYYLGRIAEQSGQMQEAMDHYRAVQDGRRVLDSAIRQAVIVTAQGGLDTAREFLNNLRARYPEQELRLFQVEGELLFQSRQDVAAEAIYNVALARYPDDSDLLYGRAIVRERLGQFPKAEDDLRKILAQQPDEVRALNALGYMLSNHSGRIEEAASYVQRALAITPDDPAVIDSAGWLYYRQGQLVLARNFLERAYAGIQDAEIAAHLGEVMWMQGDTESARAVWRQALQKNPTHPALNETIQRLDPGL